MARSHSLVPFRAGSLSKRTNDQDSFVPRRTRGGFPASPRARSIFDEQATLPYKSPRLRAREGSASSTSPPRLAVFLLHPNFFKSSPDSGVAISLCSARHQTIPK